MKKPSLPEVAVGQQWPGDGLVYVCRLKNPLIVAIVDQFNFDTLTLHAWPPEAEKEMPLDKMVHAMKQMAVCHVREVQPDAPPPEHLNYAFGKLTAEQIPEHLFLDNFGINFAGILRMKTPMSLWRIDEDLGMPTCVFLYEDGDELSSDDIARVTREVGDYFAAFQEAERSLDALGDATT